MKKLIFFSLTALSLLVDKSLVASTGNEFWLDVNYLYWNATQSNMTYAVIVDSTDTFANPSTVNQKTEWSSGFKLGAGYCLPCCWDTHFLWTRLHNSVTGSTSEPVIVANQLLAPGTGFVIGGTGIGGPASSKWNLDFDMFDLDFGFTLCDNAMCSIHPFIGLKGGKINQNELIIYENFLDTGTQEILNASIDQVNNYWGVGPQAGFSSAYKLGCGFSLIGDFAIAALFGKHHSTATTHTEEEGVTNESTFLNKRNKLIPTFQLFIGLDWNTCLCDCYSVSLGVGYETQYFWNTWRVQNSTIQNFFITNAGFGDLMLNGLTANITLGF